MAFMCPALRMPSLRGFVVFYSPRVQVPNNHILSKILTYITTILKPSTSLLGPLDPWVFKGIYGRVLQGLR